MATLTENQAARYAEDVVKVLATDFPIIGDSLFAEEQIARHAQNPDVPFEMSIDFTREWRLHREDAFKERRRVKLGCHKDNWTEADIRFSDSVNARLRAIRLED